MKDGYKPAESEKIVIGLFFLLEKVGVYNFTGKGLSDTEIDEIIFRELEFRRKLEQYDN